METPLKLKRCPGCGATKPLDEFHRDRSNPDGRCTYCKPCTIAKVKARQERKRREMGEEAWLAHQREIAKSHRLRTGYAYQRMYDKAWGRAARELIARHEDEFEAIFTVERALVEEAS